MQLEGTYIFDAPRDVVWDALMTPEVLARVIPGCKKLEQTDENHFLANLLIKVGPVQGDFQGAIELSEVNAPVSYIMLLEGRGQAGFVKGTGNVRLEDQGSSTLMHYGGEAQVGGRMASVGQRLMDSTAKAMAKQGLDGLHRQVKARLAVAPGTQDGRGTTAPAQLEAAEVEAPSQMEFALGVAKNMLEDMLPPERQRWLVGGGLGLVALVFVLKWWIKAAARKAVAEALNKS